MRPLFLRCLLSLIAASALPAAAAPASSGLRPDILYTAKGEFVQVEPMRPLTLNAHVEQFAYEPLGIEAAVVGSEVQGDQTVHFVKTIDTRTGHELSRLSATAPTGDRQTNYYLLGWSSSGKYLLMKRYQPDPQDPNRAVEEYLRWDLSADPPVVQVINPEAALPPDEEAVPGPADSHRSPDGRWLAFQQEFYTQDADGKPGSHQYAYLLYDPERDTFRNLTLPPKAITTGWADQSHLTVFVKGERRRLDVVTGEVSPLNTPTSRDDPAASKQYPDLTLDVEPRLLEDGVAKGSGGRLKSYVVWIRRQPEGKTPLGVAAAGLMPSRYETDTPGSDEPQALWSPTGKQIAFIANTDLYVTDLVTTSNPLPKEKLALGLPLTCREERALASADLKQIGLGIVQYSQDNDEKYPTADGFIDKLYPFLKTMDVFGVGGHPFVYEQPANLDLAKMESPATTEQGYIDLPCARLVLFADGHVKSFPKTQETAP